MPPAFVATFPPIKQLPFEAKSKGTIHPLSLQKLLRVSKTTPASVQTIP